MTAEQVLNCYRDDSRFPYLQIIVYPEQDVLSAMEEYKNFGVQQVLEQIEDAKLSELGEVIEKLKKEYK